jgi:cold shock CspA family protein
MPSFIVPPSQPWQPPPSSSLPWFPAGTTLKITYWNIDSGYGFFNKIPGMREGVYVHASDFVEVGWKENLKGAIVLVARNAYVEENRKGFEIRSSDGTQRFLQVLQKPHDRYY